MAPAFKTVVVFLVTFQLVHQAAPSNKFYDSADLNGPLNNKLTFHSRFNVLSSLKSKESVKQEPQVKSKEEINHLHLERGSVSRSRSKRQLDQDTEIDAEVFSNDPKMFSYGKSMPMTTTGNTDDDQHEAPESGFWNEDVDTTNKNSLGGLEDKPKKQDDTTNGEQDKENSQSEKQLSTLHSQFQDISSANHDQTPKMNGEDNLSASSSQTSQSNSSEIHIVPTILYEDHVSKEIEPVESKFTSSTTDTELQDDASIDDDEKYIEDKEIVNEEHSTLKPLDVETPESHLNLHENNDQKDATPTVEEDSNGTTNTEGEPENNEMGKDDIVKAHKETHSSEAAASNGGMLTNEKDLGKHDRELAETLSKELDIDDNDGELSEHLDKDDVDVFLHFPGDDSDSKSSSGKLKLLEDDSVGNSEEGSGDMESDPTGSLETNNMHDNAIANGTDNNPSAEISTTTDNTNFNIDTDAGKTNKEQEENEYVDEDEDEDGGEIESPIADPTEISSKVDDPSETSVFSESDNHEESHGELPTPDSTGNSSNNDDHSMTYDRKAIINPFNIDNTSDISKNFAKAMGILDSSEETTEEEELEGSGDPILFHKAEDKNSLENGAMFKTDPHLLDGDTQTEDYSDVTTIRDDTIDEKEVTEEPILVHHHDGLLNSPIITEKEDDVSHVTQESAKADGVEDATTELGVVAGEDTPQDLPKMIAQIPPDQEYRVLGPSINSENGSVLPVAAGINEMGIKNGEKTTSPENRDEPSSSSTGSFIVLGAIMATIVALLGYSVIKSYRQKHETSRRPPEDDIGTELKEIDTLLPISGKNGHGPPNRLHVESDRLLGQSGEGDSNDMKPDCRYPIYQNGVQGDSGITDKPNNGLQIDDPNDLSEVKVNTHNPNTLTPQVANGLKSSPGNSDHNNKIGEPKSPSADDRGSRGYGTKPETAKIKMFIDHDSIPKTPIVIVKRGPANVEM